MSTTEPLNIISPKLYPNESWNESEALGAITWLWVSITYASPSAYCGDDDVCDACVKKQAICFVLQGYAANRLYRAYFDEVEQAHYLQSDHHLRDNSEWNSGDNIWQNGYWTNFRQ